MKSAPHLVPAAGGFVGPVGQRMTRGRMVYIVYEPASGWDPIMLLHWPHPEHPHLFATHVDHMAPAIASGREVIGIDFEMLDPVLETFDERVVKMFDKWICRISEEDMPPCQRITDTPSPESPSSAEPAPPSSTTSTS